MFVTEAIENLPAGWRAQLTWKIVASNEFHETFELAAPDKDFQRIIQGHWKRVKD